MKKTLAVILAALLCLVALPITSMHAAAEDVTTFTYEDSLGTAYQTGKFTVTFSGTRALRVIVQKETDENTILVYDELLEDGGTYVFILDCCEYDYEEQKEGQTYTDSYTIIIEDEEDPKCAFTQTDIIVPDPGFSDIYTGASYTWTVESVEAEEREVVSEGTDVTTVDGVMTGSTTVTLSYIDFTKGDVDGDGEVTLNDAVIATTYYVNSASQVEWYFTEVVTAQSEIAAFSAADIDTDDEITFSDCSAILSYYVTEAGGGTPSWDE